MAIFSGALVASPAAGQEPELVRVTEARLESVEFALRLPGAVERPAGGASIPVVRASVNAGQLGLLGAEDCAAVRTTLAAPERVRVRIDGAWHAIRGLDCAPEQDGVAIALTASHDGSGRPDASRDPAILVEIARVVARGVFRLPKSAILDGDRVALVGDGDRIELHPVLRVATLEHEVLVRGCIPPGQRICVTPPAAVTYGQHVVIEGSPVADARAR